MALTPNYGFIIPTGSDAVNLLTQCYPNFSSLDTILKPIQESGVTVATDTKVGAVHQLVRTDSSCNMFRFIATGNYASGDTFTVDGASVTATAMDGTALSAGAFVINQSVVCILNNLVLTVLVSGKETTSLPASSVTYTPPTGLTSTNVQDAIGEVYNAIPVIPTITEHGVFELWRNPASSSEYAESTFTINSETAYDALWIEIGLNVSEALAPKIYSLDMDEGYTATQFRELTVGGMGAGSYTQFNEHTRPFNATYDNVNKRYTVTIGDNYTASKATNVNTAYVRNLDNAHMIPYRILGLVHNS